MQSDGNDRDINELGNWTCFRCSLVLFEHGNLKSVHLTMTHSWSQCESHFADILLCSAAKVGKMPVNASTVFITAQLPVPPGLLSESLTYTPRAPNTSSRKPRAFD